MERLRRTFVLLVRRSGMARKKIFRGFGRRIYLPTKQDIDAACAKFQERWSERERRKRSGWIEKEGWTPPVVSVHSWVDDDGMSVEIGEG